MNQDWDEIKALQESLREHMAEIHRLRAAGRRALEALENDPVLDNANNNATAWLRSALAEDTPPAPKELNEASLNELVEELKNLGSFGRFKPTHMLFDEKGLEYCKKLAEERDVSEPTPQPVAYISGYHKGRCIIEAVDRNVLLPVGMALYRAPTMTEQESRQVEPVAWLKIGVGDHEGTVIATTTKPKTWNPDWWRFKPLYTAPPKRELLKDCGEAGHNEGRCGNASCLMPPKRDPLTDEQICEIFISHGRDKETFARAIERAHGIGGKE